MSHALLGPAPCPALGCWAQYCITTHLRSSVRSSSRRQACCLPGPHDSLGHTRGYGAGTVSRVQRAWWPPTPAAALVSYADPRWRMSPSAEARSQRGRVRLQAAPKPRRARQAPPPGVRLGARRPRLRPTRVAAVVGRFGHRHRSPAPQHDAGGDGPQRRFFLRVGIRGCGPCLSLGVRPKSHQSRKEVCPAEQQWSLAK
jgi:hypothetical protein